MSNFFNELKNRNVYKAATAYAVTAWLILQVVDILGPNLGWPDSIGPLTTKILLVGFPITLVLTWLYEFTPQGLKRTGAIQQDTQDNRRAGKRLNTAIIGVLAIAICLMLVERVFFAGNVSINERQQASIAVLPFVNMSSDEENEYFADGLTEQILDELANLSGLKVPARTSSFKFKDKNEDIREIGKLLGVNYILEGSVQFDSRRNRIKITTQLINAGNGYHLSSETYEDDFEGIFTIQEDVARKVASKLSVVLLPEEDKVLSRKPTENPEAYKLYVKARTFSVKRNDDDLKKAIALLNQAIEIDPYFAEAYAELCFLYGQRHFYGNLPLAERNEKMQFHLNKALELAPEKPEVLRAKALWGAQNGVDFEETIKDLQKAVSLKPSYADAHFLLGQHLGWNRQVSESTKSMERALELDPFNGHFMYMLAQRYFYTPGKREQGLAMIDKAIKEDWENLGYTQLKARMMMSAPYGKCVEAFKLVHANLKIDKWDSGALNHLILFSLNLDLLPLADKYVERLRSLRPDNPNTFWMIFSANQFAGRYEQNMDLAQIWSSNGKLRRQEILNAFYATNINMNNPQMALQTIRDMDAEIFNLLENNKDYSDLEIDDNTSDPIAGYIEILRLTGNTDKADILAHRICQYQDEVIEAEDNDMIRDNYTLECLYLSNDVIGFTAKMDSIYFISKNRLVGLFQSMQSGDYPFMENTGEFKAVEKRITEEVHRQRAKVIEYLKEEGDWDPAWDMELGLE